MANAKQLTLMGNGKGQPENVKNGSKIVVMWSICSFAIMYCEISLMLDLAESNFKES